MVSMGTALDLMAEGWTMLSEQQREQARLVLAQRRIAQKQQANAAARAAEKPVQTLRLRRTQVS